MSRRRSSQSTSSSTPRPVTLPVNMPLSSSSLPSPSRGYDQEPNQQKKNAVSMAIPTSHHTATATATATATIDIKPSSSTGDSFHLDLSELDTIDLNQISQFNTIHHIQLPVQTTSTSTSSQPMARTLPFQTTQHTNNNNTICNDNDDNEDDEKEDDGSEMLANKSILIGTMWLEVKPSNEVLLLSLTNILRTIQTNKESVKELEEQYVYYALIKACQHLSKQIQRAALNVREII